VVSVSPELLSGVNFFAVRKGVLDLAGVFGGAIWPKVSIMEENEPERRKRRGK